MAVARRPVEELEKEEAEAGRYRKTQGNVPQ